MEWFEGDEWDGMKKKPGLSPNYIGKLYCGFKMHYLPYYLSFALLDISKEMVDAKTEVQILQFSSLLFIHAILIYASQMFRLFVAKSQR